MKAPTYPLFLEHLEFRQGNLLHSGVLHGILHPQLSVLFDVSRAGILVVSDQSRGIQAEREC
jgi:hypothetical protein